MPGIAGIIYPDVFQQDHTLDAMLHALEHRGGSWETSIYKSIQIGSRGATIASDRRNNISAVIDGTIFNLDYLKGELKKIGREIHEPSQENVIIEGYEAWGEELPLKIDGSYSIAILDREKESLFLIRDRIGMKPLYWFFDQDQFLFASELKSLLASSIIPQTPALDALAAYLSLGYFPQDLTPILRVNKLLPAHYLHFTAKQGVAIHSYWSYSSCFSKITHKSPLVIAEELDTMFNLSTKERLSRVENIGCFVSGGLGSATIAYYVHKAKEEKRIKAFTAGFQGQNDEDVEAAEIFTKTLDIPLTVSWMTPDTFLNDFVKVVWYLDEPLADHNVMATWELGNLATSYSNVVFSGMGSDELFAGHNRYSIAERSLSFTTQLKHYFSPMLRTFFFPLLNLLSKKNAYLLLRELRSNPWQSEYLEQNILFDRETLSHAFPALKGLFDTDILLRKFHNISRIQSVVSSLMYIDVKTRLPDCYILQYERLMSAKGLDWRAPFLDRAIIEYVAQIPEPQYLREYETASYLKRITEKIYPKEVVQRPKKTRRQFLQPWLDISELKTVFHLLLQGTLIETGLLSEAWLRERTRTTEAMSESFDQLWAIMALEVWFRLFINFPVSTHAPSVHLIEFLTESKKG